MAEGYVRPPLVGSEPRSDRAAVWRFRVVLVVLFLALAFGAFLLVRWMTSQNNEGSPTIAAPRPTVIAGATR